MLNRKRIYYQLFMNLFIALSAMSRLFRLEFMRTLEWKLPYYWKVKILEIAVV